MYLEHIKRIIQEKYKENDKLGIIGEAEEYRKFAVCIPLVKDKGELQVLLQVRAHQLNSQPGEISFPGGKIETGETSRQAALRECTEELNISPDIIEVMGNLDTYVTHHNRIIYTYVVMLDKEKISKPNEAEVDHIFYVPLKFFIESEPITKTTKILQEPEDEFPYSDMVGAMGYKWTLGKNSIFIYKYNEYIIWGITAKIMNYFAKLIKESL